MPTFSAEELERYTVSVFRAAGATSREAQIIGQHLVESNLAGHDSHGVLRIPQYLEAVRDGKVKVGVKPEILAETVSTAIFNGRGGFGQVIATEAMNLAINKAQAHGISAVTSLDIYHSGRIASYTKMAAAKGLIAIVLVNAGGGGQSVAPFGGLSRRLATNPLSIAAPSGNGHALVLDIATSMAPEGKIRDYYRRGQLLPVGWIINAKGQSSTDPRDFYDAQGALLPLGGPAGYKGFGLGFMIDILAGALSGAGCCRADPAEPKDGLLMIALDVKQFIALDTFYGHVHRLVDHVKSCPPAPGFQEVFVPGEVEIREEQKRRAEGIVLDERIWREIQDAVVSFGLNAGCDRKTTTRGVPLQKAV